MKINLNIGKLLQPKEGSDRWLRTASIEAVEAYRSKLSDMLMSPKTDGELRWQIRDYILPYIDRVLNNRKK